MPKLIEIDENTQDAEKDEQRAYWITAIKRNRKVIMSYFPEMILTREKPDSSDSNSESYNSSHYNRLTVDHKTYTPFLAEIDPKKYEVMLFYKEPNFEDVDEDSKEDRETEKESFLDKESKY